jgi:dTDP-4-dehydrorhamnose reductase
MPSQNKFPCILVTGANGQLGNEIKIFSLQYPSFRFLFSSRNDLPIENSDLVDLFFEKNKINYCVNCAAYTAVDKAESEKEEAFLINAEAVGRLAKICKKHNSKFIHISTDYVYDDNSNTPLKEQNALGPNNVYGLSKLRGEELAFLENPSTLLIRTSWVYSSFGNNFVKTMLRLFKERDEINVVDDQLGSPTYAADLADVIMKFIEKKEEGNDFSGIVNYSNSGATNWYEFAKEIKRLVDSDCKINPIPTAAYKVAAKRPLYSVMDTSKIKELLNLKIPDWKESLKKCIGILME